MSRIPSRAIVTISLALLLLALPAKAFICQQTSSGTCLHWVDGNATVKSFLGPAGGSLINGTITWDQNAIGAANDWSLVGADFRFTTVVDGQFFEPCGPRGPNHACPNTGPRGDNPLIFDSSTCGGGFGDIVAQTINCFDGSTGEMINAPVFINDTVPWNAYDGCVRNFSGGCASQQGGTVLNDLRRVVLHELGHVLGLDHPDDHDQAVAAIMNSRVSDLDRLQTDDRDGLVFVYPHGGPPTSGCHIDDGKSRSAWAVSLLIASALLLLRRSTLVRFTASAARRWQ